MVLDSRLTHKKTVDTKYQLSCEPTNLHLKSNNMRSIYFAQMEVVSRSFGLFINHSYWGILSISIENMFCVQNCLHAVSQIDIQTYEGRGRQRKMEYPLLNDADADDDDNIGSVINFKLQHFYLGFGFNLFFCNEASCSPVNRRS